MGLDKKDEIDKRLCEKVEKASSLLKLLQEKSSLIEKLEILRKRVDTSKFSYLEAYMKAKSPEVEYVLLSLFALDQAAYVFGNPASFPKQDARLDELVFVLIELERFYAPLGGIIGYHIQVLELMQSQLTDKKNEEDVSYSVPPTYDVRHENEDVRKLIVAGIQGLQKIGELYPVGGAGDRLHLVEEKTQRPLPVAHLRFLGRTMLEGLVRDLEAREYLYYKLFHEQLKTPIVLMTSKEKSNDKEIQKILEDASFFGRGKENFLQLIQPLTPVIAIDGNWSAANPLELILKPGGHGVIWKLANDNGAFTWLEEKGRSSLIVRQINNPLAGLDYGLLTLCGYGMSHQMAFGFASCPRRLDAQEGMNVLKETKEKALITNVEYTELFKCSHKVEAQALFPANTNILYAKIQEIKEAVKRLPIPGMLVNMKLVVQTIRDNKKVELQAARLESTMQNIADTLSSKTTFITMNDRAKIISVTKKSYESSGHINDTPDGALYDLLLANQKLLKEQCGFEVAPLNTPVEYLKKGPSVLILYHPALGPLYSIIKEKVRHGKLYDGSELQLEIAELSLRDLELEGSLLITAKRVTGKMEGDLLLFSEEVGRCHLHNVKVKNKGIDREQSSCYWKNDIVRKEALKITLEGRSEFYAENVEFHGNFEIFVPDETRAIARKGAHGNAEIVFEKLSPHNGPNLHWQWNYHINEASEVFLSKKVN